MKRFFSEVQRKKAMNSQLNLLKQDLKDCLLLKKSERYRAAYIFLFDSLERIFDLFFITNGEKPTNRIEREELIFRYFSPATYRKFRSFYYERRGGMYEDFLLITKRDFTELLRFFSKIFSEIKEKIKNLNGEIEKILQNLAQ
jgi:hypothetical protein